MFSRHLPMLDVPVAHFIAADGGKRCHAGCPVTFNILANSLLEDIELPYHATWRR
jgi:hypothetical protein